MKYTENTLYRTLAHVGLLLVLSINCALANTQLVVTGVEGDMQRNVELHAGVPPDATNARKLRRYVAGLPAQGAIAMNALGYYSAEFDVSSKTVRAQRDDGDQTEKLASDSTSSARVDTIITIHVTPNEPVRVTELALTLNGDANEDPTYKTVLADLPIKKGDVFVSGLYESTKSALIDQAQDLGYFEFFFTESTVKVSRRSRSASIMLTATTGPRYTFGDIIFEQNVFRRSFLNRWLPFETGAPYESGLIGELTQNLQNSGYFKKVRVVPLQDRRYGTQVPIRVTLERRDNNEVAVGVGYATDTKARTKLSWGKPLINRRGHSANAEFGLSKERQNLTLSYRVPRRDEPLYNYWGIEYGLLNDETGDTDSFLSSLNFQRVSRTKTQWIESLFLRWEREKFTAGGIERETDLVLPGVNYSRTRSRGTPFPTWGQSASLVVMGGSKDALSTIDFFKALGKFRYLKAISDRNTLIGSVQYGIIKSNDYDTVPVSHRFFAGGDRSVRGFHYKDISPRNPSGDAVGGRFLETLSLEYNYRFLDLWSAAVFADAGRAFNTYTDGYSVGAGIGLRWQSPIGPFRIDLATPITDDGDGFRIHLSLGPDL